LKEADEVESDYPDATMLCTCETMRVGYAFVIVQVVTQYYDPASAMMCGTIFPDLCIPKGKYGPMEDAPM